MAGSIYDRPTFRAPASALRRIPGGCPYSAGPFFIEKNSRARDGTPISKLKIVRGFALRGGATARFFLPPPQLTKSAL